MIPHDTPMLNPLDDDHGLDTHTQRIQSIMCRIDEGNHDDGVAVKK